MNKFLRRASVFLEHVLRQTEEKREIVERVAAADGTWTQLLLTQHLVRTCCTLFYEAVPRGDDDLFVRSRYLPDFIQLCELNGNTHWSTVNRESSKFYAAMEFSNLQYYTSLYGIPQGIR